MKIKPHKILFLLFTVFIFLNKTSAQTVLISPTGDGGFETGATFGTNNWTVVNGTQANKWFVGSVPTGFTGTRCAYISNNGTGTTHNYATGSSSVTHIYRDVVFPPGQTCINLTFSWKNDGEWGYDYLAVYLVNTGTTPVAGTELVTGQLGIDYDSQTAWQTVALSIPAANAGTTKRLVFSWANDNLFGFQPPAAIDNISLVASNGNVNDEPCNATPLTVGTTCNFIGSTNGCASGSAVAAPGCAGYSGGDVWFSAVVPASGKLNFDSNIGTITDGGMAVYTGTCSSLTQIACDDDASLNGAMPAINLSNLTPGTTVFIRFWEYGNDNNGSFQICVLDPCPTGPGSCMALLGTGVTNVGGLPYNSGAGTTNLMGDDLTSFNTNVCGSSFYLDGMDRVWIFTPTTSGPLTITLTSTGIWTGLMLYDDCPVGSACFTAPGQCVASAQSSTGNKTLTVCVTANVTYYLVLDCFPTPYYNPYSNLYISAPTGAGAPTNDQPCNATPLPLGVNLNGDNGCTGFTGEPAAPGCWLTPNVRNTVWYSVVPTSSSLKIRTFPGLLKNTQIAVYSGVCGVGLTLVDCNDDAPPCGTSAFQSPAYISQLTLTGLTPGTTYYIVVDGYGDLYGTFSIMAIDGSQSFPPIFGQECSLPNPVCAQSITVGDPGYQAFGTLCDFPGAGTNCLLTGERGSAFYEIQISGTGFLEFNIVPNDWAGAPSTSATDYDFAVWKSAGTGAVNCTDILNGATPLRCNYSYLGVTGLFSNLTNSAPVAYPNFDGAYEARIPVLAGEKYLLNVSNFSNSTSGFTINFGVASPINYTPNPGFVVWTGGVNTDWFNTGNWGGCAIPTCAIDAIIPPSSANQPVIYAPGAACKSISINPGSSLTINAGFSLSVCGDYLNNGTLTAAATSTVIFNNGSINQSMDGNLVGASAFGNVTITKTGGTVTTLDNVEMRGNFTVSNATSSFNANAKYHKVGGHFMNSGTYTPGVAGSLELNGSSTQDYQNTGALNNCIINKSSNIVNLLSNMLLGNSGNLTLTWGNINTSLSYMVIVTNRNVGSCTPGHNNSFVAGFLRRYINPTGSYDFPVGSIAKSYQRANVNFAYPGNPTIIDYLTASFYAFTVLPPGIGGNECSTSYTQPALNNGYWTISASNNPTSGNYDMTLYNQAFTNASSGWTVMKNPGGGWGLYNGTCVICTPNAVMRLGMNGFSDFATAQSPSPLPLQLLQFEAFGKLNQVNIYWTTTSEKEVSHFELERSLNETDFEKIALIDAHNNPAAINHYMYEDKNVSSNVVYYYRLKQMDVNGFYKYSDIKTAELNENNDVFTLSPNPYTKSTSVQYYLDFEADITIDVIDPTGNIVKNIVHQNQQKGFYMFNLNLHEVTTAEGIYTVRFSNNGKVWSKKLVYKW